MSLDQFYRLEWLYTVQAFTWIVGGLAVIFAGVMLWLALSVGGDDDE